MAKEGLLLVVDGIVNLALGILLVFFPAQLMDAFGLPKVETFFYVNILGAVLFGIGTALLLERYGRGKGMAGLGIAGAIAINVCGAGAIVLWLLFGNLDVPPGGTIFLWSIVMLVLGVAVAEMLAKFRRERP